MESVIDPRMQFVFVGDQIFIRRSNRKTFQKAEVVSITPKHGFVNVEWRDHEGNLWGREVTIGDVIELNPHLVVRNPLDSVPGSRGSVSENYQEQSTKDINEQLKTAERRAVQPSTSPEVDKKEWLAQVQARLSDARARSTTLPKQFVREQSFRSSSSECDEEDRSVGGDVEPTGNQRKTTMQYIGEASHFFKSMLTGSGGGREEVEAASPPQGAVKATSEEQLSVYYEDNTPFASFQPRTMGDPFYSPLLDEMYAQVEQRKRNTPGVHDYPRERKYSSPSTSKNQMSKSKVTGGKPNASARHKSDSVHSYGRSTVAVDTYNSGNLSRRSPIAGSGIALKSNNSRPIQSQGSTGSRGKSSVVETIQRLERDREQRRRKQEERRAHEAALRMRDPGNTNWKFAMMVNEYRQQILCDPLKMTDPLKQSRIIVCIRKRPLNVKEVESKEIDVITIPNKDLVLVHEPKAKLDMTKYLENHVFRFDYTFDENSTNELVYQFTTKPLIETVFEGGMATVFAYGQTGSGKTHTMGGNFTGTKQDCNNGIYMNVARDIFQMLNSREYEDVALRLSVSFFEIYKGRLYDLLAGRNEIKVMEDVDQQIQIVGLTELYTDCLEEVVSLIRKGNAGRTSGKTAINPMSSRSHSVFQLILRQDAGENNKGQIYGKFSLIDLAGNERGVGKGASTDRQLEIEGAEINKSLLALKECIRALARSEGHIPFRGSKLTLVLKDTFMNANSRVCMIGTTSPGHSSCNCSLNTILYANRVKEFNAHDPVNDDISSGGKHV